MHTLKDVELCTQSKWATYPWHSCLLCMWYCLCLFVPKHHVPSSNLSKHNVVDHPRPQCSRYISVRRQKTYMPVIQANSEGMRDIDSCQSLSCTMSQKFSMPLGIWYTYVLSKRSNAFSCSFALIQIQKGGVEQNLLNVHRDRSRWLTTLQGRTYGPWQQPSFFQMTHIHASCQTQCMPMMVLWLYIEHTWIGQYQYTLVYYTSSMLFLRVAVMLLYWKRYKKANLYITSKVSWPPEWCVKIFFQWIPSPRIGRNTTNNQLQPLQLNHHRSNSVQSILPQ